MQFMVMVIKYQPLPSIWYNLACADNEDSNYSAHPVSCADPEGGETGGPDPLKNHKNIGFSSKTCSGPLKNRSHQASIQCLAIIDTPAKRHLMAFRWWANDGSLKVVFGSSLRSSTKKTVKVRPPLTKFSGSAHESGR